jgi:hypothetical protein
VTAAVGPVAWALLNKGAMAFNAQAAAGLPTAATVTLDRIDGAWTVIKSVWSSSPQCPHAALLLSEATHCP